MAREGGRLAGWLAGRPDDAALGDADTWLSFAQLAAATAAARTNARDLGIGAVDRIGLVVQPDVRSVVALLGLMQEATVVPLAADQSETVRARALDRAATERVVAAADLVPDVVLASPGWTDPAALHAPDADHVALLLPTSGTTAAARLVPLSAGMLEHGARAVAASVGLGPTDRGLHVLPMQHVGGVVDMLLAPLSRGGSVRLAGPFDAARCWAELPWATWWQAAPAMLAALLDGAVDPRPDLPHLRFVRSVSAPLPATLRARAESALGVPVVEIYGMTETAGVICSQPPDDRRVGSVGRPVAVELRLVDDDGAGGSRGEVQVRGPQVLAGYAAGPGRPLDRSAFDGDWLRTGDIGRLDTDGHLYLVGRAKDMVNHGGEKVAPADVDEALLTHPDVVDAAAFGIPHPTLGEVVAAVVVAGPGRSPDLAGLQAHVASALPRSHVPRQVGVVPAIPRSQGKLARASLPALLADAEPLATAEREASGPGHETDDERRVRGWVAQSWRRALDLADDDPLAEDADFFAAGGDSLRAAAIVAEVGDVAGELVYVLSVYDAPTIRGFERLLAETYPATWARLAGHAPADARADGAVTEEARAAFADGLAAGSGTAVDGGPEPVALDRLALIASAPRSGSTLLRAMLAGHPAVFAPPELYLLPFATMRSRRAAFPGGLSSQLEGLERAWVAATGCDADAAVDWVRDLEAADASTADVYRLLAEAVPDRLLVDKTPMNALHPAWLARALATDDLRVVHLVRHPAAVAESFAEARLGALWWPRLTGSADVPPPPALLGTHEAAFGELLWCRIEDVVADLRPQVASARWTSIRFEELVADPGTVLAQVCAGLGLPWDDAISARVLDPYDDAPGRMTDGLRPQSRMIGDPKFARHRRIDETRGMRGDRSARALAPATTERAVRRGYADPAGTVTSGQRRLWRLARLAPEHAPDVVPVAYRLVGPLDLPRLEAALTAVATCHDALRTTFPAGPDGEPIRTVHDPEPVVVPITNLTWVRRQNEPAVAEAELGRQVRAEVSRPVDVETGPLWRARLLQVDRDEALLVLAFHRLVFDGTSRGVFEADLARAYAGARLEPAPASAEVAAALVARARAHADDDVAAWAAALDGLAAPTVLPVDHDRPAGTAVAVSTVRDLPADLVADLAASAAAGGPSTAAWWLAATAVALHRRTGQEDPVLLVPTAGRTVPAARATVGGWSTLVPARLPVAPGACRSDVVAAARAALITAVDHDGLSREEIVRRHPLSASPALVSVQHRRGDRLLLDGLEVQPLRVRRSSADIDLAVHLEVSAERAVASLDAHAGLFDVSTLDAFLADIESELRSMLSAPEGQVTTSAAAETDDVVQALRSVAGVDDAAAVHDPATGRVDAVVVLDEHAPAHRVDLAAGARAVLPAHRMPARLRAVDAIPLRPDGAVDRLRVQALARTGDGVTAVTGPRDELESVVARAWQDVLWRDEPVDVDASFRDYGGHSLLAVQLVVELEERLGRRLPPQALARLDTVAGLAAALRHEPTSGEPRPSTDGAALPPEIVSGLLAHTATWEGERHRPDAIIVGRSTAGGRVPLFWCLQNEREHRALAGALGQDQPVYAMRSGNRVMVKSDENIDLLAAHYVDEIREIRPEGPYLLGGNCQAARIALRVARRLRADGDDVPVLLMMEKFDPLEYHGAVAMLFGDRSDRDPFTRYVDPGRGYAASYRGPLWVRHIQGPHGQFFTPENVPVLAARVAEHLAFAVGDGPQPPGLQVARPDARPVADAAYRATVALATPDRLDQLDPGGEVDLDVVVRNASPVRWLPDPQSALGVGARWRPLDADPTSVATVAPLRQMVEPGEEVRMTVRVPVPTQAGPWTLELDMVDEGVTWFGSRGSVPWRTDPLLPAGRRRRLTWRR